MHNAWLEFEPKSSQPQIEILTTKLQAHIRQFIMGIELYKIFLKKTEKFNKI